MIKNNYRFLPGFLALLLMASHTAFALPVITSGEDQDFIQNYQATQLFDIKITEDATSGAIKAGEMKVTIPNTIEAIFDSKRTAEEMILYGSAVDSGKIDAKPKITFVDGDKSIVFPVKKDFALNDFVVLTRLYAEGFHGQPSTSVKLQLTTQDGSHVSDLYSKYIQTSSNQDTTTPDLPTAIIVSDVAGGLLVQWKDPTDLDLQVIQVFKGKNGDSPSGPIVSVAKGVQQYLDKAVTPGDVVEYQFKSSDGLNDSMLTSKVTYVAGSGKGNNTSQEATTQSTQTQTQSTQQTQSQTTMAGATTATTTIATTTEHGTTEDVPREEMTEFTDVAGHWARSFIITLEGLGVVSGKTATSYAPDDNLTRAEMVKIAVLAFDVPVVEGARPTFKDVSATDWYEKYFAAAEKAGIIAGYKDGTARPNIPVNRAEALKILLAASGQSQDGAAKAPFKDVSAADWFADAVYFAYENGIVNGKTETIFAPADNVTRAEMAKMAVKTSEL